MAESSDTQEGLRPVVIGTSSGGLATLKTLAAGLPENFGGSIFIAMHLSPEHPSILADILRRSCKLPVTWAQDGDPIRPGHVYVAPVDRHLVLQESTMRVSRGPRENRFRPSVDVLFRSAAWNYKSRAVGVVLTGSMDDGAAGLYAVKEPEG